MQTGRTHRLTVPLLVLVAFLAAVALTLAVVSVRDGAQSRDCFTVLSEQTAPPNPIEAPAGLTNPCE